MKKIIMTLILSFLVLSLLAISLESKDQIINLDYSSLELKDMNILVTEKEKDGEVITRTWQGIKVEDILANHQINDYKRIAFIAPDNYLVHLTREEINQNHPLLAFYLNQEKLEDNSRLVISGMPAMYWIRDIDRIKVEYSEELGLPNTVFIAEQHLAKIDITENPIPFKDCQGFYFRQLVQTAFTDFEGEFLLIGKDGVSHTLDYQNFLAKAVLVKKDSGFMLQSPQMPGGMWVKDLAYIQMDEIGMIFISQFNQWQDIVNLRNWTDLPNEVKVYKSLSESEIISTNVKFSDPVYKDVKQIKLK